MGATLAEEAAIMRDAPGGTRRRRAVVWPGALIAVVAALATVAVVWGAGSASTGAPVLGASSQVMAGFPDLGSLAAADADPAKYGPYEWSPGVYRFRGRALGPGPYMSMGAVARVLGTEEAERAEGARLLDEEGLTPGGFPTAVLVRQVRCATATCVYVVSSDVACPAG